MYKHSYSQLIAAILRAAGQEDPQPENRQDWFVDDRVSGGRWFFQEVEDTLLMAWSDEQSSENQTCFSLAFAPYQGRLGVNVELYRPPSREQFAKLAKHVLMEMGGVPSHFQHRNVVHQVLNDLFLMARKKEMYQKGAMAEAGLPYVWDTEPKEELKDGAWEVNTTPRLSKLSDIPLSMPEIAERSTHPVTKAMERAALKLGTMDERHSQLYQGSALDGQKKPSENN